MKIKCNDGIVRDFVVANLEREAYCTHCGYQFGIHDTKILKPRFKEHICDKEDVKRWLKD